MPRLPQPLLSLVLAAMLLVFPRLKALVPPCPPAALSPYEFAYDLPVERAPGQTYADDARGPVRTLCPVTEDHHVSKQSPKGPARANDSQQSDPYFTRRFTGKERDAETGLDYFGARYLAAAQGRFTSADPKEFFMRTIANPQKWNKYAYTLNNPLALVDPDGKEEIRVTYDEDDRVTGASSGATSYLSGVSYAPHGGMSAWTLGGQIAATAVFNPRLQATEMHAARAGAAVLDLTYGFDSTYNNGNLTSHSVKANNGLVRSQSFSYDPANRLKTAGEAAVAGGAAWSQTFAYDPLGNRAVVVGGLIQNSAQTPQVAADTEANVGGQFSGNRWAGAGMDYDGAGNQKAGGAGRSFVFDAENRVSSAVVNGVAASYFYDGEGRRVKKVDADGTTVYVYAANGELAAEYFTGASGVTQPARTSGTRYLLTDHLGSTRLETDAAMTDPKFFDYAPFGEDLAQGVNGRGGMYPVNFVVPDKVTQRFTGKERDAETGLDYFGARYMSSAQGRFTSADAPFADQHAEDPQSWNLYGYGRNNPLRYNDPDGRLVKEVKAAIAAAPAALETTAGDAIFSTARLVGGLLGGFFTLAEGSAGGQNEDQIVNALNDEAKKNTEAKKEEKEPEASADGAGARKGGGKTGRKINEERALSATEKLAQLKTEISSLAKTPNKTPEIKEQIAKLQGQINRQTDRLKNSEEHARQKQR